MEITELKPHGNRVVVERITTDQTAGGLYLPETAQKRSLVGKVKAVGKDVEVVKVGQHVFFGQYSGFEIGMAPYSDCLIMNEDDILGEVKANG